MPAAESPPDLPFAVTKIQPPNVRRDAVSRPRLEAAMAAALSEMRLVSLVAPAGFGKTVALAVQVRRVQASRLAVAWTGAEEDDDLPRLVACIVAALEPYDVPWRRSPDAIVAAFDGADAARRKALAGELVNALAGTDVTRGFIVIEDAHRLRDPCVFDFLDQLIERLPRPWCVVVSSRVALPLATARLRLSGEFAEFDQQDFRFDVEEVRALAGAGARNEAAEQAEALLERTGGWAAGLCLALQASTSRAPLADRHVFEYVAAEVLSQMPEAKRTFLLRCSVLPELSAARCETVSGDPEARRWLQEIEAQGLFGLVRGRGDEAVLVLHDLFRDCLDHLLMRERSHELSMLLKRAASVEGDVLRRIGYLARAGAWNDARKVLFDAAPGAITAGMAGPVLRLIEQWPAAERSAPEVDMVRGLCAWAHWDFQTMRQAMHRAAAACTRSGDVCGRQWAQAHEAIALAAVVDARPATQLIERLLAEPLQSEALMAAQHARGFLDCEIGPLDGVCAGLESELDEVERRPSAALWYKAVPNTRNIGLPGFQHLLERFVSGALAATSEVPSALRALTVLMQAWLVLWAGQAEAAASLLEQAAADAHWLGQGEVLGNQVWIAKAFMYALRGEADLALDAIRRPRQALLGLVDVNRKRLLAFLFDTMEARVASAVGRPADVIEAVGRLESSTLGLSWGPVVAQVAALQGHAALARGDLEAAEHGWRESLAHDEQLRMHALDVELRVRLAAIAVQRADTADAAALLRPVFARSRIEEVRLPAIFAGRTALERLATHRWQSALARGEIQCLDQWRRLAPSLEAARGVTRTATGPSSATRTVIGADLTQREIEVLDRLAAGDSNKVIARAFDLSPYTVKRHVANLLDKLAVSSRGQAAAWFNANGRQRSRADREPLQ